MKESFPKLFEESLKNININPGSIISGTIIEITKNIVLVDSGLKSESYIPINQFIDSDGTLDIKIGDKIDVVLDTLEDGFGETILSREKAKKYESWIILENAYKQSLPISGIISGKVKGGFTVEINNIRAFLPGSLVDVKPIRDTINLEGKEIKFKVIKLDKKRNNVVVSRKALIELENNIEREQMLKQLSEGAKIEGIVKNLTDYGAFIDLGGVDGLLHITDMSWKRIKHPSEIISIGNKIKVKVLKFDRERTRVSLGLKQLSIDPWISINTRYPIGKRLSGRVTNLTDYGCFIEIENGIEGLVHISEMDWTNKNVQPFKIVNINDIIEVMVLDINKERRRISLGIKQCINNPWKKFFNNHKKGDIVRGKIKSITDFGIFIGLEDKIDGLVHLSDISWVEPGEEAIKKYKKNEEISAGVIQVDYERERISLSIKQILEDPFKIYISKNKKNSIVEGKVIEYLDENNITVKLKNNINGLLNINNLEKNVNKDKFLLKIKKIKNFKIININKKNRVIFLSLINKNITNINKNIKDNNFSNAMTEAFKAANKNDF